MNTRIRARVIAGSLALCLALGAAGVAGAQVNPKLKPGYVDFEAEDFLADSEMTIEIEIGGPMIRMARKAIAKVEPEIAELLEGLFQIRVYVFSLVGKDSATFKAKVNSLTERLDEKGWSRFVRVRDKKEMVDIYLKLGANEVVQGLAVFVVEEGREAVFVNIVGEIDPEQFGEVAAMFMDEGDMGDLFKNIGDDEDDEDEDEDEEDEEDEDDDDDDDDEDEDDDDDN